VESVKDKVADFVVGLVVGSVLLGFIFMLYLYSRALRDPKASK
jgi:hypothetical protein